MKKLWIAILSAGVSASVLFAEPPASQETPARSESKAQAAEGTLPEVIIKGGDKSGVESEKPPLEIQMNLDEAVLPSMEIEQDLLKRQPEALQNPRSVFSDSLYNQNIILPARIRLAKDPIKIFYPLREIMAVSPSLSQEIGTGWEIVVTDTEGRPFRKFSGGGLPPSMLPWNGRSDKGEIISVGKSYSMVVNYKDTHGQARNFVGESFSFDGVVHQESKGLVVSLSLNALFNPAREFGQKETLSDQGMDLVQEAADWIKRYYFTYPFRVECYTADGAQGTGRAQTVAKTLANLLLLPRGEIESSGIVSDLSKERIDILITNR